MRAIGKGRTALETFCGLMGMLPHSTKQAYASHNKKLYDSALKEREASFAATAELRIEASEDDIIDITVTCDGTWARRGFQSLYSVVVVASWDTGKVLDVKVLSKHCQVCAAHRDMNSWTGVRSIRHLVKPIIKGHHQQWSLMKPIIMGHHQQWSLMEPTTSGEANYNGSSPAMESHGALNIW